MSQQSPPIMSELNSTEYSMAETAALPDTSQLALGQAPTSYGGMEVLPGSYRILTPEEVAVDKEKYKTVKAEMKAERLAARNWLGYLLLVDRWDRLEAFLDIMGRMRDAEYWQMLAHIWMDTEAPSRRKSLWLGLFGSRRNDRDQLMSRAEHAALAALPEVVQLYRGAPPRFARGMSWTTDWHKARWFADRFHNGGVVYTARVAKAQFLAFLLGRGESEAVIDPWNVQFKRLVSDAPPNTREAA